MKSKIEYIADMKDDIRQRKQMAFQGWHYAVQRIDILIVSISGAGVYTCLEALKFSQEKQLPNLITLKIAGAIFVMAIIVNLFSQFTGKKANALDMQWSEKKLKKLDDDDSVKRSEIEALDNKAELYSNLTDFLNILSFVAMSISLILLILFFAFTPL